jgi:hypothetical protein
MHLRNCRDYYPGSIADVEVYEHWWSGIREPESMMEPRVVRGRWSTPGLGTR